VDISLDHVYQLRLDTKNPDIDFARQREHELDKPKSLTDERNRVEGKSLWVERNPDVTDYYDENDRWTVIDKDRNTYQSFLDGLDPWEKRVFERAVEEDKNYYVLDFSNIGGLVMPIILELSFEDGSKDDMYIPAEIWRRSPKAVSKLIVTDKDKVLSSVTLDPRWETADVEVNNNHYPRKIIRSRIEASLGKGAPRKSTFGLNAFSLNAFCLNTITCTALLFTSLSVFAHQQKQAITKVYFNSRTSNIEIMHRFDIHDAEHAVREIFGGTADILNKPETQQQFSQYVADRFDIFNANKQALALVSVGYEIDGKHFWVYQETPAPDSLSGMYISHNALRDIWHSQTNTINIEGKGKLKTLTFTDNTELLEIVGSIFLVSSGLLMVTG